MKLVLPKSRQTLVCAVAIALISLAAPFAAQAKDNWLSVQTKNFLVVGNGSEKEVRQVATRLEQFRDVFTRLFGGVKFKSPVPTTVIVFKSMGSYKPFRLPNAAGYFQKGEDVNYITLTTELDAQNPFSVIYHEYVHLLIDNTSGNVPAWFNEGLAEYYSSFAVEEDRKVHLGDLLDDHLLTLRVSRLLPLRKLFEVDHYSPEYNEASKQGVFYAQSWALVHYLMMGNSGQRRPQMSKFVDFVSTGTPIEDAFKSAFQTDVETLEKELKKYIEGNAFKMQLVTFKEKLEFENEMKVAPLSEAEAQAYLGDLLLHTNKLTDAEKRLEQALLLDPKQTMAQASLGILRSRQGRFAEAKKVLQEAVNGNSSNYLAHYYYAFALSREGMDENNVVRIYPTDTANIMRAELNKAIELNPNFPESYSLLAFVNTVTGEDLDKTVDLLIKALTLSPGRQDLRLLMAQVYMRKQKFDLAKSVLAPLRNTKDRRLKLQAESLLKSITNFEEQIARYSSLGTGEDPALRQREDSSPVVVEEGPRSRVDYIQEALRPVAAGEERIQGQFIKLECDSKGAAYFMIQSGERLYKIRASALGRVELIAYVSGAAQISCGARKTPENVVLIFRPTTDPKDLKAKINGDAVSLELVPKEFQLKP
jgi:tetratricopeptide (TPR) repeat protein